MIKKRKKKITMVRKLIHRVTKVLVPIPIFLQNVEMIEMEKEESGSEWCDEIKEEERVWYEW